MAAIELEGLTKDYGDVLATDDLTFGVERGEVFGYLGPNGAGKTTTIRMLMGFIKPTAGTGRVLGYDIRDRRALIDAKRRIGYLSDEPGFDEQATGREILDLHASVKGDERSDDLLELFDPPLDRTLREYSRGNVQKLGLVTTFMHEPDLVLLDEPTSGLDPLMKQRFAEFLREERRRGVTVFFSSHILSEVRRLCDRVGIIRQGRLVTIDPVETLLRRSGKVVRVHSAKSLPQELFELDGVHDLKTGGSGGGDAAEASGRGAEVAGTEADASGRGAEVAGGGDAAEAAGGGDATQTTEGRHAVEEVNASDAAEDVTECAFTFTGDINALLARLPDDDLLDVSIEEAPLEDVFMRFYGEEADV